MEKQSELLNTQLNADTNNKSTSGKTELIKRHHITNTPFVIIEIDEQWCITWGKYKLTEMQEIKIHALADAEIYLKTNNWEITAILGSCIALETIKLHIEEQTKKMNAFGHPEHRPQFEEKHNGL